MRKAAITGSAAAKPMPLERAYRKPAAASSAQPIPKAARNPAGVCVIALILAFGFFITSRAAVTVSADQPSTVDPPTVDPPANLAKLAAHRETETEAERNEYTYRQTVTLDELDSSGGIRGSYSETRDIIFSPTRERTEQL